MKTPREFWVTINACQLPDRVFRTKDECHNNFFANDSIFHVREVLDETSRESVIPIDWERIWFVLNLGIVERQITNPHDFKIKIQELVEKQLSSVSTSDETRVEV